MHLKVLMASFTTNPDTLRKFYADLLRLNIGKYLLSKNFQYFCIEHNLRDVWDGCYHHAIARESNIVLIPGYTKYHEAALEHFLVTLAASKPETFFDIIIPLLIDFLKWSPQLPNITEIINDLSELGYVGKDIENELKKDEYVKKEQLKKTIDQEKDYLIREYLKVAIRLGETIKNVRSNPDIEKAALAIFPFEIKPHPIPIITSTRSQLVINCVLTLAEQNLDTDQKNKLLHEFIAFLGLNPKEFIKTSIVMTASTSVKKDLERVFIVHGHDLRIRDSVALFIEKQGLRTVILADEATGGKTLIEALEEYSDVKYAIVLLTPDDLGKEKNEADLKSRARQNVIFELGLFIGWLKRENVCAIYEDVDELPSDYMGVRYVSFDDKGAWKIHLAKELVRAGFKIDIRNL